MKPIEMPQLAANDDDVDGATLASWLVAVGDRVEAGEVIAELETDKATVELESPAAGVISALHVSAGTEGIQPGVVLGEIADADADVDADAESAAESEDEASTSEASGQGDAADSASQATASSEPAAAPVVADILPTAEADVPSERSEEASPETTRRPTPLARRAAEANAVDLTRVEGSGPGGRVVEADVLRVAGGGASGTDAPPAAASPAAAEQSGAAASERGAAPVESGARERSAAPVEAHAPARVERLSAMRKTIARRMTESKQQVPHFYLRARVAIDEVLAVRTRLNQGLAEEGRDVKLSVNDFVVRAVALAMRDVPDANVQFSEEGMRVFEGVDVSVAVATDGGLVTPILRDADRKGLVDLSLEIKALAEQARAGSLRPEQYQGGTVTVSNLGMYGIETVYPILNLPQACIVGVGAAEAQPVARDGEVAIARIMGVTLAADHRAVDGAVGASLLAAIRGHLEDPMGMIL